MNINIQVNPKDSTPTQVNTLRCEILNSDYNYFDTY
jgi:hypothetical protein